jgi:hypothetical protein
MMTVKGKLVCAIAAIALSAGLLLLRGAPVVVPVPALTPAQMADVSPCWQRTAADDELEAALPEPGGS